MEVHKLSLIVLIPTEIHFDSCWSVCKTLAVVDCPALPVFANTLYAPCSDIGVRIDAVYIFASFGVSVSQFSASAVDCDAATTPQAIRKQISKCICLFTCNRIAVKSVFPNSYEKAVLAELLAKTLV
jgi:hypothetical protein